MKRRDFLKVSALGALPACNYFVTGDPAPIQGKLQQPVRLDARLAALWIGHASVLLQIEDKLILTDPVLIDTVGQLSKRIVEPGLRPENVPHVDVTLISHMHFDHLSTATLALLDDKLGQVLVPEQGMIYIPRGRFEAQQVRPWTTWEEGGLRVTAVPVKHPGWRYALDAGWMTQASTAYVIEYRGVTVYFGGDTAYHPEHFKETGRRFPGIDLALVPIGPIKPRDFMKRVHVDPEEALDLFADLGARHMLPIHFETFINSADTLEEPRAELLAAIKRRGLGPQEVGMWRTGEQRVLQKRAPGRFRTLAR